MIDIPGYKIVRTLGRGGMATVYLAIQESFEREVALKVMSPALSEDPKFSARFLHEARIVSRLVHPNIVTVYDVGVEGNLHFLSMEYVPGMDLKHKRTFLTPPLCLQVIRDVARALDYAGRKGYVHRDVKPENIMLHDDDGRAVLMDFGIACLADVKSGMTQTGTAIGTPHYMSPEQAKGRQVDPRSDIYSLGVVFYLMLTGRVPYDADSAVAVGIKHVQEPVPRLPPNLLILQPIIDKALAKEPKDRFQTGAELIAAIDEITDDDVEAIQLATKNYTVLTAQPDDATRVVARSKAPAQAASASAKAGDGEQIFAVAEEDRRKVSDEPATARRWPWVAAALLVLGIAAGGSIAYRDHLPAEMAAVVDAATDRGLELGTQLATALGLPPGERAQTVTVSPKNESVPAPSVSPESNDSPSTEVVGAHEDSTEPNPATPSPGQRLNELGERSRALREQLESGGDTSAQLAAVYREMLALEPANKQAEWGLEELQSHHYRQLRDALDERQIEQAEHWFAALQASFPKEAGWAQVASSDQYQRLRERFEDLQEARRQLALADDYFEADALTEPAGENAVEAYRRVLQLDDGNPAALAGLQKVADRYAQLGEERLEAGQPEGALALANRGLKVAGGHAGLQHLRQSAQAQIDRRARIADLQQKAQTAMAAGNYLQPEGESAYDLYSQLRELDPADGQAAQGLAAVQQELIRETETFINRNEFDAAQAQLAAIRKAFGESERLLSLGLALDRAVEQDFLSRQPQISRVLVSSQAGSSLEGEQPNTISVDRTLYIGFSYRNFAARTSVVQAKLYDGSRSVQIAQVPVIVSGENGLKYFQIDRPVEGFAEGGYIIDLVLNADRLSSLSFKVERSSKSAREVTRATTHSE
ncbi:protein kinase [Proteobacteria bacterium 005FR1]|nr:protein kinase [Proteobacteria bacterium 005FR1]